MVLPSTLIVPLFVAAAAAAACWLLSVISREYSWVDRIWSILPPVYVGLWAAASGWHPRLVLMLALSTLWGARLTFNFWRKGGYAPGGEDYRWAVLRAKMSPALYQVFNLTFIAAYQNLLIWLITLPAWRARLLDAPLKALDAVAALLLLAALTGETVADEQQWRFHQAKARAAARGEPLHPPFLTTGLFRLSRHPNFFCEMSVWWSFYLFSVAAGDAWLNPSLLGPVLLTLLFQGSTQFTEAISLQKYPAYARYQQRTSRLLPLPPRRDIEI